MADATKAQRLLAAKKLVKEYQKSKKSKSAQNKTPADSLTNSTHSSLNEVPHIEETDQLQSLSASPLQQYFGGNVTQPSSTNFFDSISPQGDQEFYNFDRVNFTPRLEKNEFEGSPIPGDPDANPYLQGTEDSVAYEDPEINPNEIYDRLHKNNQVNGEDNRQLNDYLKNASEGELNLVGNDLKTLNVKGDKKSEGDMETLKQLSTQIIQLIDDNSVPDGILRSNCELETKYKDTLALLEEEKIKNSNLLDEVKIYQEKINCLENAYHQKPQSLPADEIQKYLQEIERNEQTVKFLVAEKTDLEKAVVRRETELKEKKSECDELNARLKTSRSRVADLERELNHLKGAKLKNNIPIEENEKFIQLLGECTALKNQRDEMLQDISELQQKLHANASENLKLTNEIQDLTSQVSLLNIKLQQVSTGVDTQFNYQIENLSQQLKAYEKQTVDLNNLITSLNNEKEQAAVQYQQYVHQLNVQLNTLGQKLEEKVKENETLVGRERDLTNHMVELEMLLQKLQNENPPAHSKPSSGVELKELQECLQSLEGEKKKLEESYELMKGDRDEVFKELELKRDEMMQLEDMVSHLRSNQPDNVKLLAEIESDKVAASRAVAQNEELKSQLVEMQNAFIKISNEKLELAEQLSNSRHHAKEIEEQLGHLESQIHTLTDAIAIKDKEMYSLRESAAEVNRYMVQQNQLEDRLRHYEAHDHSTHALQHELQQSYLKLQTITTENNSLKLNMKNLEDKYNKLLAEQSAVETHIPKENDNVDLLSKISDLERINRELESKLSMTANGTVEMIQHISKEPVSVENGNKISQQDAMKQLEEKFTRMMEEIANLEDEKQRLEHLVLQLQDETETIGEYVTLYQHQRGVLNQRASEKEEQMRQLAVDRENMKEKIDQLNNLINRLMVEQGDIALDALQHQTVDKSQLCLEHAKVHQEMATNSANQEFNNNTKTAEKIMELLSEIKTSSLVQPSNMTEAFHPCPWCSGQLITV